MLNLYNKDLNNKLVPETTKKLLRPRVLLFGDDHSLGGLPWSDAYQEWEDAMEKDEDTRLVILEIGCGLKVPEVRRE